MSGTPSVSQLVDAVRLFLAEAETALSGRLAFHAKVAGNALAIVQRELEARRRSSGRRLRPALGSGS